MHFVGHTRFSLFLPSASSWKATRQKSSPEGYFDSLYSEKRMRPRLDIFLDRSLPQIEKAARAHDLRHVISYSAEMPERWKSEILTAADRYPWIVLDEHVEGRGVINLHRVAQRMVHDRAERAIYGTFRLDDDDLIPLDYFDRMSAHMTDATVGMYVSLGRGFSALYRDGEFTMFREVMEPKIAIGFLSVCRTESDGRWTQPPRYRSHRYADESAPVILDSREPGFLWTRHLLQDSMLSVPGKAEQRIMEALGKSPVVDDERWVRAQFPYAFSPS